MLKGFKKIGQTTSHTIFEHPDGHILHVANEAVDKTRRNEMKRMPIKDVAKDAKIHYASGGPVEDSPEYEKFKKALGVGNPQPSPSPSPTPRFADGTPDGSVADQMQQAQDGGQYSPTADVPMEDQPEQAPIPTQPMQPGEVAPREVSSDPIMQLPENMRPGYTEALQAQKIRGAAEEDRAAIESQLRSKQLKDDMSYEQQVRGHYKKMQDDIDRVSADIEANHINPGHYMENLSTGKKIFTAIGLLLGGIGQGFGATSNPALEMLKGQIERDVESQKNNLGKKETLLSALQKQYGNYAVAADLTRVIRANTVANQLAQLSAKAKSPEAKANALSAIGDLHRTYEPYLRRAAALSAVSQGGPGSDPSQAVQFLVPKEHQNQVFKEIGQAQNAATTEKNLLGAFDTASKENTVMRTGAGMLRTPASISNMRALSLPLIHDQEGRVNEFEQKTLMDLEPKPGDTDNKVRAKRAALEKFIENKKAAPTAKGYGIDLSRFYPSASSQYPNEVRTKSGKVLKRD